MGAASARTAFKATPWWNASKRIAKSMHVGFVWMQCHWRRLACVDEQYSDRVYDEFKQASVP
jgi:hypothetical protein